MSTTEATPNVVLDCETGQKLGCAHFCCRLIVRLGPGERDPGQPERRDKSCVDKDPRDGLCVYLDREAKRCTVWERRPQICRAYDCNHDPLLQVVMEEGFVSLTRLVFAKVARASDPARIPYLPAGAEKREPG